MFLDKLKHELLNEDSRIGQLPKKFSDFLLYLRASEPVTYELLKNFTDYWWMDDRQNSDGSTREATMGVAMKGGRLQFYIGKAFYSRLSLSQLAFLMYHELAHYKRGHCNHNFNLGKSNHNIANICEDIYINEDANRDGDFAGVPLKFVDGVLMKRTGIYRGATSSGIDLIMEKSLGVPKNEIKESDYISIGNSAELYKFLMSKAKEPPKNKEEDGDEGREGSSGNQPPPPRQIKAKKGDIIRGPNGQYGRVSKVMGGKIKQIEPLTKQEAESIVTGKSSFIAIQTRKSLDTLPKIPIDIS